MKRDFHFSNILISLILFSCSVEEKEEGLVYTVNGSINAESLGLTLIHEHILVDFIGADATGYHRWDRDSVIHVVLPHLMEIKGQGVQTIVECTPAYLGRDPQLLQILSELSGLQILTNTGYYGAVGGKYLPAHAFIENAKDLAERWIGEFENGIEDTRIKPGFIKISVNDAPVLSEMDEKLVRAAAMTHLATGLTIVSHTGPWATAQAQIDVIQAEGVDPSAFVWVHAQSEKNFNSYSKASKMGVWISLDGIAWDIQGHLERVLYAKEHHILDRVLLSHDAGWYSPEEKNGGDFKGFTPLFDELIPLLRAEGFTQEELDLLLIENPKKVFVLKKTPES